MPEYIVRLSPVRHIVDQSGMMTTEFSTWSQTISNRSLIVGVGAPEGVIEAVIGAEYMNSTGTASSVKYIKQKSDIGGDKTMGWILI